ncbi:DUF1993 domain-containing protein [Pendulispora brunnea]|uniref:DUF1993 domain-containing protein n=1 Tax=Pendulispora brunnea TaxID=2905690 RepID=A0ABZ2K4R3_9BACT
MSLYEATVPQFKKMLSNLDRWLQAAVAHAETKKFDPNTLVVARLAPDQYPLARQVQAACDQAKFGAARLSGKEPPKHADTEQTIDELRARIRVVIEYLDTFTPADFTGKDEALIALPFLEGKRITGSNYITEMTYPNFYFHVTTAYAILRHNGVNLGKRDFLGSMTLV